MNSLPDRMAISRPEQPELSLVRNQPKPDSGLGKRIKVFKVGEVIQLGSERKKFCERAGKTIVHVNHNMLFDE